MVIETQKKYRNSLNDMLAVTKYSNTTNPVPKYGISLPSGTLSQAEAGTLLGLLETAINDKGA